MKVQDSVRKLFENTKGVFGSDADDATLHARFARAGISQTEEMRRAYRELLFTTPGIERFLSAVFLPEEAFRQTISDGTTFPNLLASKGIMVGFALGDSRVEEATEKIRGLRSFSLSSVRCRITLTASDETKFLDDARTLSEFARTVHALELLPVAGITLPDTPRAASQAEDLLVESLSILVDTFEASAIPLPEVVVEIPMADSAGDAGRTLASEVAERTMRAVTNTVPDAVGGILLRSFDADPQKATEKLNAIARLEPFNWPIAYSFTRVLTDPVLDIWRGREENVSEAQSMFRERLSLASSADMAGYSRGMEESNLG